MAKAMASFDGIVKYGNATFASATEICEVKNVEITYDRDVMDATNRCAVGKKRYVAGELDVEISADFVINKDASAGSEFDLLRERIVENLVLEHVWIVDAFNDGIYLEEVFITNLTETQNTGSVIEGSITLKNAEDISLVFNGAVSSGTLP